METEISFRFESKKVAVICLVTDVVLEFLILVISGILFYQFDLQTIGSFILLIFGSIAMVHASSYEAISVLRLDDP